MDSTATDTMKVQLKVETLFKGIHHQFGVNTLENYHLFIIINYLGKTNENNVYSLSLSIISYLQMLPFVNLLI